MSSPRKSPALSVAQRIDSACDRFEAEWRAGRKPRIEKYLADMGAEGQADLLRALLAVELELLVRAGSAPSPQAYLQRFARHRPIVESVFRDFAERTTAQAAVSVETSVNRESARDTSAGSPFPAAAALPRKIGRFEVLGLLGQGAFGRVYKARDPHLHREVAIKVPLPDVLKNKEDVERFLREARAAATLQHPNLCPVHEVGQDGNNLYIVMAFVDGKSLAAQLAERKQPLPAKQAALIVRKLAQALSVAHVKGVIHRDLKPANIMFDKERKDVVIMDFGLARKRANGDALQTREGVIMGTPAYMAPEQARGDVQAVGPGCDIYSLGVILYEMLAGRLPFTGSALEVIGKVLHVQPEPPSMHRQGVDAQLEKICLKAMDKDAARRYDSMKDLVGALDAFVKSAPSDETASKPGSSVAGRQAEGDTIAAIDMAVARHSRKNLAILLAAFVFVSVVMAPGIIFFARTPTATVLISIDVDLADKTLSFVLDGKGIAADELARPIELKVGEHELIVFRGKDIFKQFRFTVGGGRNPEITYKDVTRPVEPPVKPGPVKNPQCALDHLDPAAIPEVERRPWHPPELVAVLGNSGMRLGTLSLAFSPDNTLVAAGGEQERSVKIWEVATGKEVVHLGDFPGWVCGVAFSPDGKRLYAGSGDEIRVVDFASKKTLHTWRGQRGGGLAELALSRDGKLLAVGGGWNGQVNGNNLELWDTTTGQKLHSAEGNFPGVAFSPDGKTLAVGGPKPGLWDVAAWKERQPLALHKYVIGVAFSGDGRFLATAGNTETTVGVWDAVTGKHIRTINCQQGNLNRVAFQANGQVLATGGDTGTVKLWETATGQEVRTLRGAPTDAMAMTPDGQTLATGAGDGVRLWECATGRELFPRTGIQEVGVAAVSPDGATIATGGATIRLWDARTGKARQSLILHKGSVGGVAFNADGKTLASGSADGTVRLWDAATGDERKTFTGVTGGAGQVAFSRDGRLLATTILGENTDNAKVWDLTSGKLLHTLKGQYEPGTRPFLRGVAFSPTESLLAACSVGTIRLWDPATGQQLGELTVPSNEVNGMVFSPDGRRLASGYFGDMLKVWDVATRKELRTLRGHGDNLSGVAWSPDGKLLASAGADGTVRLWDGASGAAGKVFRLHSPSGHLGGLAFSPEGRHLLVTGGNGVVYVLRLRPPEGTPKTAAPANTDPDHLAADSLIFDHPLSAADTLDKFQYTDGWIGKAVVEPNTGLRLQGSNTTPMVWPKVYLGDRYRVQFEAKFNDRGYAGWLLNGPGYGAAVETGYACGFNRTDSWLDRLGVRVQTIKLPKPVTPDEWATVQADVNAGKITLTINGMAFEPFVDADPLTGPLHGWFGLTNAGTQGGQVIYRNLRIWSSGKDTNRALQLSPPATEPPRANGKLLYEFKLADGQLGSEWWKSEPASVTVEGGGFRLSGHTPNVILTRPFRGEIGCEIEFEFPTDAAFGNMVRLLFASKAPKSYQDCEFGWLAAFGSAGPQVHCYRGPADAHEFGGFWSKAPLIANPMYYATIPRRKYVARVETVRDRLRVFQDGGLVATARKPEGVAAPTNPVYFGLSQFDSTTKVYGVRIYQLEPNAAAKPQPDAAPQTANRIPADAKPFNGRSYKFFSEQLAWKEAKARCEALGGQLVIIDSLDENKFVGSLVAAAQGNWEDCWIGATDEAEEGRWLTVNGQPLPYTNWFPSQPNNKNNEEHYALMSNRTLSGGKSMNWQWSDQPNVSKQHRPGYVCEWAGLPGK